MLKKRFVSRLIEVRSQLRRLIQRLLDSFAISVVIPFGTKKFRVTSSSVDIPPARLGFIGLGEAGKYLPHRIVGAHLQSTGNTCEYTVPKLVSQAYSRVWTKDADGPGTGFSTFTKLVAYLVSEYGGDFHFTRGLIDEYLRRAPRSFLVDNFYLPDSFLKMAEAVKAEIDAFVRTYDGLVLVDSAYLTKRSIISAALHQRKPVWILNSKGQWIKLSGSKDDHSPEGFVARAVQELKDDPEISVRAARYLEDRLGGRTNGDVDAPFVYGDPIASGRIEEPRKVLFLHAIRDANGLQILENGSRSLYVTYLEWTIQALKLVAKEPDKWWIKPHPQKALFPDEPKIIRDLAKKYSVPCDIIREDLNTRFILANKFPVYTHSGTIAFEAAAHGYKAHIAGPVMPERFAEVSRTQPELENHFREDFENGSPPITSELDVDFARVLLYLRFNRPAVHLAPKESRRKKLTRSDYELRARAQTISLISRYARFDAHETARSLAREIVVSLSESSNARS